MAYISSEHFDNDIFLSYARVDDQRDPGQSKGWVELFHEYLEMELSRQIGRMGMIDIWRDRRELASSSYFDAEIQKQINRSAIFLSLTSNGYLHPQSYCLKELQWFYQKAQTGNPVGLSVDNRSRIFNVLLYNIPPDRWPAEYAGTSGQPFHDAQRPTDPGAPVPPNEDLFKDNLRKLVRELFEMLEAVKRAVEPRAAPQPAPVADDAFTVYLADTADSLRAVRKRVVNELEQGGVRVVSNIPPPYPAQQHEEAVTAAVAGAHLAVHLLNDVAGREIDDDPGKSYVQKQVEISLEHAKSQFIWVPKTLDVQAIEDDDAYRDFLDGLENGRRAEAKYNFIRESPASISREILARIKQLEEAVAVPEGAPSAALLDTHLKDQLHALDLSRFLLERSVISYINPEGDNPQKNIKLFQEMLKRVSVLVIIYGQVAGEWVHERLVAALQIAVAENCPLKLCGIYLPPDATNGASRQFNLGDFPASPPVIVFPKPESFTNLLNAVLGR
jgi:hypothetical protein